jgi:hypothetical protein
MLGPKVANGRHLGPSPHIKSPTRTALRDFMYEGGEGIEKFESGLMPETSKRMTHHLD